MALATDVIDSLTRADCDAIWKAYMRDWNARDIDAILSGYSDDIVAEYGDLEPIRGRSALRKFLEARFARISDYRVDKTFKCFSGDTAGGTFTASWLDLKTGKRMQSWGAEFSSFRGGKCYSWICRVSIREVGVPSTAPLT